MALAEVPRQPSLWERAVIGPWVHAMVSQGKSPKTVQRRRRTALRFAASVGGEQCLSGASRDDVEAWIASLRLSDGSPLSAQSRAIYLKDLRQLFQWMCATERCASDPTRHMPVPRSPRYLPRPVSDADLRRALDAATGRMRTILVLGAFAGLRCREIAALRSDDVDWDRNVVVVRGKGDRHRVVPMHPEVQRALLGVEGPIVQSQSREPGRRGGPVTGETVVGLIAEHFRSVGSTATGHQLRHWFGTTAYRQCRDLRAVQELMGHEDPRITALYVAYDEQSGRAAVAALELRTG